MNQKITIVTPQFERTDDIKVSGQIFSSEEWANLANKDEAELTKLGMKFWSEDDKGSLYLFPKEWYNYIPLGFSIKFIDGEESPFKPGVTDDDYRFGCLAFGIVKPK